jgi:methanogenic corrinoid protein MtbC1
MNDGEMKRLVSELSEVTIKTEDKLDSLMFAMLELDEYKFNKILEHNISSKGFEATMNDVVYPLMEKLSMMWIAGSIKSVHESFVANVIRRKTIVAIDNKTKECHQNTKRFLIYLPEGESHELSLLFLHFLLKDLGLNVINLGSNIPLIDVLEGQKIFKANYVFTLFNDSFSQSPLQPYLNELSRHLPNSKILISGYQTAIQNLELPENVSLLRSISDVKTFAENASNKVFAK